MSNRLTEGVSSVWHELSIFVKVLIATVILFVPLQAVAIISLHKNVQSGGLDTISGEIYLSCFVGVMFFVFLLCILIPLSFISSFTKASEPANILFTSIAVFLVIVSFSIMVSFRIKIELQSEPDSFRCVRDNIPKSEVLKEFVDNLNNAKADKELAFKEDWKEKFTSHIRRKYVLSRTNGEYVLNSNLLDKKISQMPNDVVVIFESNVPYDKSKIGGPNDISTWWHYGIGSIFVFGDGRIEFVKKEDFKNLRWQP